MAVLFPVPAAPLDAFLLSKQWRDTRKGVELELWAVSDDGPAHVTLTGQEAVFFLERTHSARASRRAQVELRTLSGHPVDALYFESQQDLNRERERLRQEGIYPAEADVKPADRFLMERFVTGSLRIEGVANEREGVFHFTDPKITAAEYTPRLTALSLDIETDGLDGPLLSIAGATADLSRVFVVKAQGQQAQGQQAPDPALSFHEDETSAFRAFLDWVAEVDPDLILGWNVVDFDLSYLTRLAKRLWVPFALGRASGLCEVFEPRSRDMPKTARVPGRVVLDGIATLRSATLMFESFALDDVAHAMLGRGKDIEKTGNPVEEIRRMWRHDPLALARYNLEDCRLVLDIFKKARLVEFAVERQRLTGLVMDRQGGSVAAFDQLYLPRLHRAGFVAPSVGDVAGRHGSPGGHVMSSKPGLYRNVVVLDFKSLYPSIIRTFLVDPLGLAQPGDHPVEGFDDGTFSRQRHILPGLIEQLWTARDAAKTEKNAALSTAIKIIMNSFYGVLGSPGCRFFDARLVSSITKRGHQVILQARAGIEAQGLHVIYGDTDSLFVLLDQNASPEECQAQGRKLAQDLTAEFRQRLREEMHLESALEMEYETHFHRFLMPTIRGSETGTKKRYAGAVVDPSGQMRVVFKGLEAVRTDWTPLARRFQRELFRRVFADEPYEDFIRQTAESLRAGRLDEQLVYTKRLRRKLEEYSRNLPPHVQAAKKLKHPGKHIQYVITKNGPEPVGLVVSKLDYEHYLTRQLAPAADSILHFAGGDFEGITGRQMSLF